MHLSENEGIEGKTFVVTGGLGFIGSALCLELVRRGARQVRAFDIRSESAWSHDLHHRGVRFIQGDVSNKGDVEKALQGANYVFHLASYGMSGKEMVQYGRIDQINIDGTCQILNACLENGVSRLVYVSTAPITLYLVDKKSKEKGKLYSCAIRPAAIYGPGEERHLPRIIKLAKLGLLPFKIGEKNIKSDWVYVDNIVLAMLLASMGLLDNIPGREGEPVAAGYAYFISDGSPVNSFEFLQPLLKSLDYNLPKWTLPVPQALYIGKIFWVLYSVLYPWLNRRWLPQPLILPDEVYKVGVTHYFSFLKAKEELGYRPLVSPQEGMAATIAYWKERKRRSLDGPTLITWLLVVMGMSVLFCAAYLPDFGLVPLFRAISLFFLRSMTVIRTVFLLSVAAHVGEGVYAWQLARKCDPANARGWFWQTFALGFFSLRYLLKRADEFKQN